MSYMSTEESRRPELEKPKERKYYRYSRQCFCTGFVILLVFVGVLSVMVALPLAQRIKEAVDSKYIPKNKNTVDSKDKPASATPKQAVRLIDPDTPRDKSSIFSRKNNEIWELQFSDEFNKDGRTFRPGDDPAWEAVDLWYEATGDEEYYDPGYVTTQDGKLVITIDEKKVGDLKYTSGMLQSWNKVCFTVSVSLPGNSVDSGFWPGAWTLGNLARAGYKATTDGVWPYSYDTCDSAVAKNQSITNGQSWLVGQKLNKCVCSGEDHPSPGKGRGAPEIDLIEATVGAHGGEVSQSLQIAPFDDKYRINEEKTKIFDKKKTEINSYRGGELQQAVSALTKLPNTIYGGKRFALFAIEYEPGPNGYITWFLDDEVIWTVNAEAIGPNKVSKVSKRLIPEEPMSIIFNLAISSGYSKVSPKLQFPSYFLIDYVRLYQHKDRRSVDCDPVDYPTAKYISEHPNAYNNKNWTHWEKAGYTKPKYSLNNKC